MKLEQEQKLEELRLKSELAQNQAMLNVCLTEEREEMSTKQHPVRTNLCVVFAL